MFDGYVPSDSPPTSCGATPVVPRSSTAPGRYETPSEHAVQKQVFLGVAHAHRLSAVWPDGTIRTFARPGRQRRGPPARRSEPRSAGRAIQLEQPSDGRGPTATSGRAPTCWSVRPRRSGRSSRTAPGKPGGSLTYDGAPFAIDPATSGKKQREAIAGKELSAVIRRGDHVIVARLDRPSRSSAA